MTKIILTVFMIVTSISTSFSQEFCPIPNDVEQRRVLDATESLVVPIHNSLPGAPWVLFLSMHEITITSVVYGFVNKIFDAPNITPETATSVWERSSEDHSLWNINVTTDSNVYNAAAVDKRMRVIITPTSAWYPASAGGVSFIGSLQWGDNTPCFVFSDRLGNISKYIGECVSHELGHTLGLSHQSRWVNGIRTELYHSGTGVTGSHTSWAPIMGVSYYNNNTTHAYGLTSANVLVNEIGIIEANGIIRRGAVPGLLKPNTTLLQTITVPVQSLVNVSAISGGNTDIKIKLNGVENNIIDSLDARLSLTLPAGTYNLETSPVINPNNPSGVGNHGQVFTSVTITPLTTVSLDTTTRYVRTRSANFRYTGQTIYFKPSMRDEYRIVNMTGQRMKAGILRVGMNEINISNLPAGIYVFATQFTNHKIVLY